MRTLHHIGIPTDRVDEDMTYLEDAGVHVSDPDRSPNRIEWLRFEDHSGLPGILKTMPHIAYRAINEGASGVDMGRNVFQSENPISMIKAVRGVVHEGMTADHAFEMYKDLS